IESDKSKFQSLYNKEVNFVANQGGGYRSNYPRAVLTKDEVEIGKIETKNGKIKTTTRINGRRSWKVAVMMICSLVS
ncbi:MAG: hypothetical protein Q8776_02510, partial [Sweet potato little leaf phytoplasma]|nr:hypothetical protein [Sweet potato little leaf phytoplasma]